MMRDSARLVIHYIGVFMILAFASGIALLVFRPNVSEALITALIVTPVATALGALAGMLAGTERTG